MLTPVYGLEALGIQYRPDSDKYGTSEQMRDKLLLISATGLAISSAFRYGKDLPVGAVAAAGDWINGRYFASDRRAGYRQMHAEYMAVQDAGLDAILPCPDTVVVTIEPCEFCQDFLATIKSIKRVGFALARSEVAERGLVKSHEETIFERAQRLNLPYEVVQIEDPFWQNAGRVILDNVIRDPVMESLEVNMDQLARDLQALEVT